MSPDFSEISETGSQVIHQLLNCSAQGNSKKEKGRKKKKNNNRYLLVALSRGRD